MNSFRISDKITDVREATLRVYISDIEFLFHLDIWGDTISMPVMDWNPHLGDLGDMQELKDQEFDPFSPSFKHILSGTDFFFTIAGDTPPVHDLRLEISRTSIQDNSSQFVVTAKGRVSVGYDDEYDDDVLIEIECEAKFDGITIYSECEGLQVSLHDLNLIGRHFEPSRFQRCEFDHPFLRRYKPKLINTSTA
jgi:hypothetical protein